MEAMTEKEAMEEMSKEKPEENTRHKWLCKCNKFSNFKYTDRKFYYHGKERMKLKENEKLATCIHCNKEHLIEVR